MKSLRIYLLCGFTVIEAVMMALPSPLLAAGRIVVAHDDLVLADGGFHNPADPGNFAQNVARWFTGERSGRFLAYSDNQGLTGGALSNAMRSAGHAWVVDTGISVALSNLLTFDGVFLCGHPIATEDLVSYVNAGGNVYVAAVGVAEDDMPKWNPFLREFGLGFTNRGTGVGDLPTTSPHSIFEGVDHLYGVNGSAVVDLQGSDPINRVLAQNGGLGLFAVWGLERGELVIRVSEVEICWQTESNHNYGLEYRSSLTTNAWTPLSNNCFVGDGSIECVKDSVPAGEPQRFYRTIEVTRPSHPPNLRVVPLSDNRSVSLSWDPSHANERVIGYIVYSGTEPNFLSGRMWVGNQTSVTVTGLTPGVSYYFAVTATNACGFESEPGPVLAYVVPSG